MSDDTDDTETADEIDRQTQLLLGIAAELTTIRRLLQEGQPAESADDAGEQSRYECRCGESFDDERPAHQHARRAHSAPEGHETEVISEVIT
jgi:hypothetical protein